MLEQMKNFLIGKWEGLKKFSLGTVGLRVLLTFP